MGKNKKLSLIIGIFAMLSIIIPTAFVEKVAMASTYGSVFSYKADDNTTHNVYWQEGVNGPKMASSSSGLLGTEGYFEKEVIAGNITYQVPFYEGNGYYDLNKDIEQRIEDKPLCYLASASNLLYWWLEQNKPYIERYIQNIKDGVYGKTEGLVNMSTYDKNMWDNLLSKPTISNNSQGLLGQQLTLSPLINYAFRPYVNKQDDGYYMDCVHDFFFNGYKAVSELSDTRNEEQNFIKDSRGGYFYPLFNRKQITERINSAGRYDVFSKNVKQLIEQGKGITLSYFHGTDAHAITIWGAEYDSKGNIEKIFVTDSDDYGNSTVKQQKISRGMHSMYVIKDSNGAAILSSNPNAKKGVNITEMHTLSLARDMLEESLSDNSAPSKVSIKNVDDLGYNPSSVALPIKIETTSTDKGYLTYEWYVSNDSTGVGTKVGNKTNTIIPDISTEGEKYYYCEVTNHKNGKTETVKSRHIKVTVSNELVDAQKPKLTFNSSLKRYQQYESPSKIYVSASIDDGGTLSYQWYKQPYGDSSVNLSSAILMEGENKNYIYPTTNVAMRTSYFCVVTNTKLDATGSKQSTAVTQNAKLIIVEEATLQNASAPTITNMLQDKTYYQNDSASKLVVDAVSNDGGKLSYKWYKAVNDYEVGELVYSGENNYYIPPTNEVGSYYYYCEVTNTNNSASNNKTASRLSNRALIQVNKKYIPSSENNLISLTISNGILNPIFNPNVTNYMVNVAHSVDKLTINAQASEKATFTISDTTLNFGLNTIVITVKAENGLTKDYTLNVNRSNTHDFGEWVVIKQATTKETGLKKRVCSVCGKEETEVIPKKDIPLTPIGPSEPVDPETNPEKPDITDPETNPEKPDIIDPEKPDVDGPDTTPDDNKPVLPDSPSDKPITPDTDNKPDSEELKPSVPDTDGNSANKHDNEASLTKNEKLAVGLGVGIPASIILIVIIVVLVKRKR